MKIEMKDPKGVTLLTAGKKLDENIEVVPTFDAVETVEVKIMIGTAFGNTYVYYSTVSENGNIESVSAAITNGEVYDNGAYYEELPTALTLKVVKGSLLTAWAADGGGSGISGNGAISAQLSGILSRDYDGLMYVFRVDGAGAVTVSV